jgi:hypothetical protein
LVVERPPPTADRSRPFGDIRHAATPVPHDPGEPSCRYLPSRVLSQPSYDAHWLRQASDVHRPRGLRYDRLTASVTRPPDPLLGFGSATGYSAHPYREGTRRLPGFLPFQRLPRPAVTGRLPHLPLPAPRFSQPPGGSDGGADSRVCSTPLALLGFWSSELHSGMIGYRRPVPCSFAVARPSQCPSLLGWVPAARPRRTCPSHDRSRTGPLVRLRGPASVLGLGRP